MKEHFSKIGFVLAMAGSAVGLGNAWKFPTMVGQNGGSAFILLYLLLTILVAFMVFLAELSIGRLSRKDSVNAFYLLANNNKKAWSFAGFFMIGAILIVCFYSVVIGWIVYYIYKSFFTLPQNINESAALFSNLLQADIFSQIICFSIVFIFIFLIVNKGIKNGIEKMNVFMMPALFILLLLMLIYSFSFDGFLKACEFLFYPDFSKLNENSILNALGLSFFSMSIGVCAVLTYAASLPDKINVIKSTLSIILINVLIGIMMGLIIFTFVFEFGADSSSSGPGLIFVSLTNLFSKLGILGNILAFAFFVSLFFAGVTSAVSMIEPFCFYLINRFNIKRSLALFYIGIFVYIIGILCILSSAVKTNYNFNIFSYDLFSLLDFLTSNILMPLSAIIICIFVAFCINQEKLKNFFIPYMGHTFFLIWINFLRFICPIAIAIIAISNFI
ncbi:sodium-dependent transporter [Campylobacter canadensis]|uniref:Sodium-dependent transporter n=1 Tax=Campylobacter canadensis TaxID=449520 RepID=A0ABS7WSG8_9BACT|nr:sodium-dependent transporter [Campylobacter canadensis]MBZ7987698.1 sodium-dependent transporter [Campylobacter canadensis]MBZ7994105.1 sodium-dependent transporter [Campylobacter canadensis]MBZ7995892.1 sodium-dependent transporter [Campylobacter canadensis]MBZ7997529.1 sodium-dependent transporter [Campylobacter canadensis]MBZ7999436.1 sodium-dependent transporter [Campylobacter canadensis]